MVTYNILSRSSEKSLGNRLIWGIKFLFFFLAFSIMSIESAKTSKVSAFIPVSNEDLLPIVPPSNDLKKMKPEMEAEANRASFAHVMDIREALRPWDKIIQRYSQEFGVDPELVRAVLFVESSGNPNSVSRKGARGLMQLTRATADFMNVKNVFDPEENIKAGVKYMGWLIKKYDETSTLLAYNAGISRLEQNRIPLETRKFIARVLSTKTLLKENRNKTI
jgi:soluble lytic murein transglycosylase-like protein